MLVFRMLGWVCFLRRYRLFLDKHRFQFFEIRFSKGWRCNVIAWYVYIDGNIFTSNPSKYFLRIFFIHFINNFIPNIFQNWLNRISYLPAMIQLRLASDRFYQISVFFDALFHLRTDIKRKIPGFFSMLKLFFIFYLLFLFV